MFSAWQDSLQGWWDGGACTRVGTHTHGHTCVCTHAHIHKCGRPPEYWEIQRHLLVFSGPEAPLACSNAYII